MSGEVMNLVPIYFQKSWMMKHKGILNEIDRTEISQIRRRIIP